MLTRVVANYPSVACDCPNNFLRNLFVVPIMLSHHPSHQAALGAMNFHVMPYWAMRQWVLVAEGACHNSASSRFAVWNVCALSVYIVSVVRGVQ